MLPIDEQHEETSVIEPVLSVPAPPPPAAPPPGSSSVDLDLSTRPQNPDQALDR